MVGSKNRSKAEAARHSTTRTATTWYDAVTDLTPDEAAVVATMRRTPYGRVTAHMRAGAITNIQRDETLQPPSLAEQAQRLGAGDAQK
jgi:hypothetical protein